MKKNYPLLSQASALPIFPGSENMYLFKNLPISH